MDTVLSSPANDLRQPDAIRDRRRRARALLGSAVLCLGVSPDAMALGRKPFVAAVPSRGSFPLVARGVAAPIVVDVQDHAGVRRASS